MQHALYEKAGHWTGSMECLAGALSDVSDNAGCGMLDGTDIDFLAGM